MPQGTPAKQLAVQMKMQIKHSENPPVASSEPPWTRRVSGAAGSRRGLWTPVTVTMRPSLAAQPFQCSRQSFQLEVPAETRHDPVCVEWHVPRVSLALLSKG